MCRKLSFVVYSRYAASSLLASLTIADVTELATSLLPKYSLPSADRPTVIALLPVSQLNNQLFACFFEGKLNISKA